MKKYLLLLSLLALPFAFTSCGGDDDDNGGSAGINLSDPEFMDLAKQYWEISNSENDGVLGDMADNVIVKLGEDGVAWVYANAPVAPAECFEECDAPESNAPKVRGLKYEYPWFVAVTTYKENGDNVYELKGVGKFAYDPSNPSNVQLSFGSGAMMSLVAQVIMNKINVSDLMSKIFRTWNIVQTKIEVEDGDLSKPVGKVFQGKYAPDLAYIADDLDAISELKNVHMADNLKAIDRYTKIQSITLSQTGAIEILYANNKKDVGTITAVDAQGNVNITWNGAQLSNKYLKGDAGIDVKIVNNYLYLDFESNVSVENVGQPYDVEVELQMKWAN